MLIHILINNSLKELRPGILLNGPRRPAIQLKVPQSKRGRRPMYPEPADGYCLLTSKPWRVCFDVSELECSLTSPEKTCCQSCFQVLAKINTTGHYCLECRVRNIKCYGQKPRCQNCGLKGGNVSMHRKS